MCVCVCYLHGQNVRYYDGWGHSLSERKQVALVEKGEIPPGSVEFWREQLEVPPLPPTGQQCCNVMDLWYTLKVCIESSTILTIPG